MKANINRAAIAAALMSAARVAGDGRMIPAISHIMLRAERDELRLSATDGELSIALRVDARVEASGYAIVPKGIAAVVKAMAGNDVRLENGEAGKLTVASGAMSVTLATLPASEFPEIPGPVSGPVVSFDKAAMAWAQRLLPSVGRDHSRPVLSGVHVSRSNGREALVATDSYRMASWSGPSVGGPADASAIVPLRAWQEAARITAKGEHGPLLVGDNLASFYLDNGTLTTRLIEGTFPDWQALLPTPAAWAEVDREALMATLNRVGPVVGKSGDPVRMAFDADHIVVSASGQLGSGSDRIDAAYPGEAMECGFNPAFLIDGLRAIDGPTARIGLVAPLRPALIAGEDGGVSYLIMPVRING